MRLLSLSPNGRDFQLTEFFDSRIPPYAILSHTWGPIEEEVTFQMLQTAPPVRTRSQCQSSLGWEKLKFCSLQAKKDGLDHFWIDTCCINKESSAELSEAINTMFAWYRDAATCYVYLSDVSYVHSSDTSTVANLYKQFLQQLKASRWLTRGWTLQELIAPLEVQFFSKEGVHLMNKRGNAELLSEITGIPLDALFGMPLCLFSTEDRLSWLKHRQTTRREDRAYCLQGLLEVSLPTVYGEKDRAMDRLKEEIVKSAQRNKPDLEKMVFTHRAAYPAYRASDRIFSASPQLSPPFEEPEVSYEEQHEIDTGLQACLQALEAGTHNDDKRLVLTLLTNLLEHKYVGQSTLPRIYRLYEHLLETGADPNKCTCPKDSLLWRACAGNQERLVFMLLAHGAIKPKGIIKMYVEKQGKECNFSRVSIMNSLLDKKFDQNIHTYAPGYGWHRLVPEKYSYKLPKWAQHRENIEGEN